MVSSWLVHSGCDNGPVGATYCGGVGGGGPGGAEPKPGCDTTPPIALCCPVNGPAAAFNNISTARFTFPPELFNACAIILSVTFSKFISFIWFNWAMCFVVTYDDGIGAPLALGGATLGGATLDGPLGATLTAALDGPLGAGAALDGPLGAALGGGAALAFGHVYPRWLNLLLRSG